MTSAKAKQSGIIAGAAFLPVILVILLLVLSARATGQVKDVPLAEINIARSPVAFNSRSVANRDASGDAFVFRFDPVLESFETFTIPTRGAEPQSIDVISNDGSRDVWFTETGADKIGRLVYTATNDYHFDEYRIPVGDEPLNLVRDQGFVWFTARHGNYIGRVEIVDGTLDFFWLTFPSGPTGIGAAPNGDIWFTEFDADKLGRLEVTSASVYTLTEFPINATDVGAYGIAVQDDQYVWFGETATGRAKRMKMADGTFIWVNVDVFNEGSYPFDLVYDSGRDYLWMTEPKTDRISQVEVTTLNIGNLFPVPPPKGSPRALTQVTNNEFWFTKYESGQIGRMVYTSTTSFDFDLFDLPVEGLYAADIAADEDGRLFILGFAKEVNGYSIAGRVAEAIGFGISGAIISANSGERSMTDACGHYTITNLITGTYTITPSEFGYTFTPPSRTVSVPPEAKEQDFVGISSFPSASHHIRLDNLRKSSTDYSSKYVIENQTEQTAHFVQGFIDNEDSCFIMKTESIRPLENRLYDLADNTSLPDGFSGYLVVSADVRITGTVLPETAFSVSGRVTRDSGIGIDGVIISASSSRSTTTDVDGYYTLISLDTGTYTISPKKNGWLFTPTQRTASVPPNATGQDFIGSGKTYVYLPLVLRSD